MAENSIVKKLEGRVSKALLNHSLIENGDRVMVGLSGGKDSYSLLSLLISRRNALHLNFELHACHVMATDMEYCADTHHMQRICNASNVPLHLREIAVEYTPHRRKPACFICSWKRRKMLFATARELGCNKLALGHHLDDAVETLLMNMVNHASISSIPPTLSMFGGEIQLIRPLLLCLNSELEQYALAKQLPCEIRRCRYEKATHRSSMAELILGMEKINRDARKNIYRSMQNIFEEYLP